MNENKLHTILELRLLVGYLGERAQQGWWPTAFFEPSSRLFLEPVFTKSLRLAQYYGVLEAARRVHDELVNVGTYHLFRLPEEVEQDLHKLIQQGKADAFALQELRSKDSALAKLTDLAGSNTSKSVGPNAIGKISSLLMPSTANSIAAAYLSAFSRDTKSYPYLVG